ncbi:MAG: DNA polymerase IV [Clostridia bacterium]|nr:DNA polymerase IV [Clostridia bacterium]
MRSILHCDLNGFFASVECLRRPELKNVPMAVSGDPKLRHGIILAKNEIAKKYGIYTPETVYSAKKKCPNLVLVEPHYEEYKKYSKLVNLIYLKYTDKVEPFSIDEAFLDITESISLFGSPKEIAYKIKEEVKNTLGLTISVGVSFNKIFAKMGSDMKKPDAITIIDYEHFKEIIHPLPVENMLFVGKSTKEALKKMRIDTIGDIAGYDMNKLVKKFGKMGIQLYHYANGIDDSEVNYYNVKHFPKSISKGITFAKDISDITLLTEIVMKLAEEVSKSLRSKNMKCSNVCISIKYNDFSVINRQKKIFKTDLFQDISKIAVEILKENYNHNPVRKLTLALSMLESLDDEVQLDLFTLQVEKGEASSNKKIETVSKVVDDMQNRFGTDKVKFGMLIHNNKKI